MSEREEHEFHADPRVRGGLARRCKACTNKATRAQRAARRSGQAQAPEDAAVHAQIPPDWRIAGTAFQVAAGYARSYDGDWWRVSGTRLLPVYADDVSGRVMPRGREMVERIVRSEQWKS